MMIEVKEGEQVCNNCGTLYPPTESDDPYDPLCAACRLTWWVEARRLHWEINDVLFARRMRYGLMDRMSDERFIRYITKQVERFNEARRKS